MVTVFNSIIESQDLRLRELDITGIDSLQPYIYHVKLEDVKRVMDGGANMIPGIDCKALELTSSAGAVTLT